MRSFAMVVMVLVVGCSDSKKQEAPAPSPAPAKPAVKAEAPAPKPDTQPAAKPALANPNAENVADLTITGAWEATLKGGGAYCRFNNDPKERDIDRGARIKVDTKKVGGEGRFVSFSINTDKDGKVTILQVDVTTDEPATKSGNIMKVMTFGKFWPNSQVTKAEVAPDGTSVTVDATLGSSKKDGKTVHVAGTVTCKHIGTFAF